MAELQVDRLDPSHDAEQAAFLARLGAESASVLGYHSPFYRDLLGSLDLGEAWYLGARTSGQLVGVLPGFLRRTALGSAYCSLPFFGPNAGVLTASSDAADAIHAALLGRALADLKAEPRALTFSVYTPFTVWEPARFAAYDAALSGAVVTEKFTSFLALEGAVWKKEIDYDLRRARKLGVSVEAAGPERMDELYAIYQANCTDHGIPLKPRAVVARLLGAHASEVSARVAVHEGRVIAGLIMIWGPLTASYYLPCTLASARGLQPGTLLIDDAVQEARRRGCAYWNWESSPTRDSGVYQYKMKWGSEEGSYRVYSLALVGSDELARLGRAALTEAFPYYFLYPWQRLEAP